MIRNIFIGIITVFLAAVLAAGLLITGRQDSAKAAELESINTKLRKNGYVISDLEEELAAIEKKIEDESACPATQQLILLVRGQIPDLALCLLCSFSQVSQVICHKTSFLTWNIVSSVPFSCR